MSAFICGLCSIARKATSVCVSYRQSRAPDDRIRLSSPHAAEYSRPTRISSDQPFRLSRLAALSAFYRILLDIQQ